MDEIDDKMTSKHLSADIEATYTGRDISLNHHAYSLHQEIFRLVVSYCFNHFRPSWFNHSFPSLHLGLIVSTTTITKSKTFDLKFFFWQTYQKT